MQGLNLQYLSDEDCKRLEQAIGDLDGKLGWNMQFIIQYPADENEVDWAEAGALVLLDTAEVVILARRTPMKNADRFGIYITELDDGTQEKKSLALEQIKFFLDLGTEDTPKTVIELVSAAWQGHRIAKEALKHLVRIAPYQNGRYDRRKVIAAIRKSVELAKKGGPAPLPLPVRTFPEVYNPLSDGFGRFDLHNARVFVPSSYAQAMRRAKTLASAYGRSVPLEVEINALVDQVHTAMMQLGEEGSPKAVAEALRTLEEDAQLRQQKDDWSSSALYINEAILRIEPFAKEALWRAGLAWLKAKRIEQAKERFIRLKNMDAEGRFTNSRTWKEHIEPLLSKEDADSKVNHRKDDLDMNNDQPMRPSGPAIALVVGNRVIKWTPVKFIVAPNGRRYSIAPSEGVRKIAQELRSLRAKGEDAHLAHINPPALVN